MSAEYGDVITDTPPEFGPNQRRIYALITRVATLTLQDLRDLAQCWSIVSANAQATEHIALALELAQRERPEALSVLEAAVSGFVQATFDQAVSRALRAELLRALSERDWERAANLAVEGREREGQAAGIQDADAATRAILAAGVGLLVEDLFELPAMPLMTFAIRSKMPGLLGTITPSPVPDADLVEGVLGAVAQLSAVGLAALVEAQGALTELDYEALWRSRKLAESWASLRRDQDELLALGERARAALDQALEAASFDGHHAFSYDAAAEAVLTAFTALAAREDLPAADFDRLVAPLAIVIPALRSL